MNLFKIKIKCPICFKKMAVPINKGKILITCPYCFNKFILDFRIKSILEKIFNTLSFEKFKKDKSGTSSGSSIRVSEIILHNPIIKGVFIYIFVVIILLLFFGKCDKGTERTPKKEKIYYDNQVEI